MSKYGDIDGQGIITPLPSDFSIAGQVQGDVIYFNGTNWVRLAPGTAGEVLKTQGAAANPVYGLPADLAISGQTTGDILYNNGSNWVRLAGGTSGDVLTANGAGVAPTYQTPAGGDGSGVASFLATGGLANSTSGLDIVDAYSAEVFDTGSDFNPTSGTFTAPQTGIYLFTCYAQLNNGATTGRSIAEIHITSGNYRVWEGQTSEQGSGLQNGAGGSIVVSLTSGQTAAFYAGTSGNGSWTATNCIFSGTLLA